MELSNFYQGKQVLVTGGAGFVGSHLVDRLLELGASVVVIDNFITGSRDNLAKAMSSGRIKIIEADAALPVDTYITPEMVLDLVIHAASPASPVDYDHHPVETYQVNGFGTHYLATYCAEKQIPFLFTSTSEAYGDPKEHPQVETYWGNVNPVGPRSCYDESKRFGEMVVSVLNRTKGLNGRIVRIFNTYGPRMASGDGRVIPNFITQAIAGKAVTVYGDGTQTRSFCYVADLVEYIVRAAAYEQAKHQVINIGNPDEWTIGNFAKKVIEMTQSQSEIVFEPLPTDDPARRKPDISKAIQVLSYQPQVDLDQGLTETIAWFRNRQS